MLCIAHFHGLKICLYTKKNTWGLRQTRTSETGAGQRSDPKKNVAKSKTSRVARYHHGFRVKSAGVSKIPWWTNIHLLKIENPFRHVFP